MKILSDLHHFDLYHSFQLLFENRLGHQLYRQIGTDWNPDFWGLNPDPELVECFLSEKDGRCAEMLSKYETLLGKEWAVFSLHLPRIGKITSAGSGLYSIEDKSKDCTQTAITLEAFKAERFDLLISSIPQHFEKFEELRRRYQPHAKHIFHMGPPGVNWKIPDMAKNVMLHSRPLGDVGKINHVFYRQEFNLKTFEAKIPARNPKIVRSYVYFPETVRLWNDVGLDWDFKIVGNCQGPFRDIILKSSKMAEEFANSGFTLHVKPGGESYGHTLHTSCAAGRPLIINRKDFEGSAGGALLTQETCIDISDKSPKRIRGELIEAAEPATHLEMSRNVSKRFAEVVDFAADAEKIKLFLERLE